MKLTYIRIVSSEETSRLKKEFTYSSGHHQSDRASNKIKEKNKKRYVGKCNKS